jgi:hypothetical protein
MPLAEQWTSAKAAAKFSGPSAAAGKRTQLATRERLARGTTVTSF